MHVCIYMYLSLCARARVYVYVRIKHDFSESVTVRKTIQSLIALLISREHIINRKILKVRFYLPHHRKSRHQPKGSDEEVRFPKASWP